MTTAKLLIVEDDNSLTAELVRLLRSTNYLVDVAATIRDAQAFLHAAVYDVIILDWLMPDGEGVEFCQSVRTRFDAPILFLTALTTISHKQLAFDSGADDYLTKPFHPTELLLRLNALLNRPPVRRRLGITVRDITIDTGKHKVLQGGKEVPLYPKEYALLEFFAKHPNQLFSTEEILKRVWSTDKDSSADTLRVTLMRLRQKIKSPPEQPLFVTLRNVGYRMEP